MRLGDASRGRGRRIALLGAAVLCWAGAGGGGARAQGTGEGVRVASKSFTESVILGELAVAVVRASGTATSHRAGLGGTRLVWQALRSVEIDLYPEYTGTIVQEILDGRAPPAGVEVIAWLRAELGGLGLGLLDPLGFDNGYAVGMRDDVARRLQVRRLSDLRAHPQLRLGFSSEFMSRRDGWPGLRARYQLPQRDVRGLEHDLAYRGLAEGSLDATDLYATDAEIRQYGLRLLEDDLHHFTSYQALFVFRLEAERRHPAAFAGLRALAGRLDAPTMVALNARAKLDRVPEARVALDWLARQPDLPGGTGRARAAAGTGAGAPGTEPLARGRLDLRALGRTTVEHLELTGVSLAGAILVALPLGVLAARRRRLGQVVLGLVGVVQTVPSLALLVFMIPLLGIGALPATVALFVYSLLPIVRNTHSGLLDIPGPLRESAQALGLTPRAILFRVELPLATRSILAGIKSAAVINVGTATLGALIGAGGYGQPIFTGIRLDDVGLILSGAVPASLLALAVQGLFDLVERLALPRGLRAA